MHDTPNDAAVADTQAVSLPVLEPAQARVLGCLIEKEATTPDAYPLTVNATLTAANQKTAREPVMVLDQGAVHHALRHLETLQLARQSYSSRAERYEHRVEEALSLTRQQTVLLGLLLLRGPQTVHELLARSERMVKFSDADDVRHQLERLSARRPALVVQLPRASGQREDRYMHLLAGAVDVQALAERFADKGGNDDKAMSLSQRLDALEQEVAALREQVQVLLDR